MKGGKRSWMAIAASAIVVVAVVLAVEHFYVSTNSQAISVQDSHLSVTYSAHFKNIYSGSPYQFNTSVSKSVVSDANLTGSSLSVALKDGIIFYDPGYNRIDAFYFMMISGHFITNLQPKSLTVSYEGMGLSNQTFFELLPLISQKVSNLSISNYSLAELYHEGPGGSNTTLQLLNENTGLQSYNFSISIWMNLYINWYPYSTHTFYFGAQVNGLNKPVVASVSMSIVDLGS